MIPFIFKGIIRDKSRSIFPVLVACAGVFLCFLGICLMDGMMESMFHTTAHFDTGHVKIVSHAYAQEIDARPLELSMAVQGEFLHKLKEDYPGYHWTKRVVFGGLLDIPNKKGETRAQGPAAAFGMDFLSENSRTVKNLKLQESLRSGRLIQNPGEILVSHHLAKKLGIKPGESATFFCTTVEGGSTSGNFKVVGFVSFGISMLDRTSVLMDIKDADFLLDMEEYSAEILGFRRDGYHRTRCSKFSKAFNNKYRSDDPYRPHILALDEQNNLKSLLDMNDKVGFIIMGIFIFLMVLVLWNAGLINGLRRYSEIGVRLAIGERRRHIVSSILIESLMTGTIGSIIGIVLAIPAVYYLQEVGIDYSSEMENISIMMQSVMKAKFSFFSFWSSMIPGVFSSFVGMFIASLGIYDRDTSTLFKELET
ncbi:ABC transporter permease [Candidatus Riflebacteria bacterium]